MKKTTTSPTPETAAALDQAHQEGAPRLQRDECGSFGIRIGADGTWYYQNSPIGRKPLVKLFATVLSRDDDGVYWMTTPVEHGTVEVEDAPFVAVEMEIVQGGEAGEGTEPRDRVIRLRTNLDDWVEVGDDHPLRVVHDESTGEPSPYVYVRKGLEAKINRSVYYDLVALAVEGKGPDDGADGNTLTEGEVVGVWSKGTFFPLGTI